MTEIQQQFNRITESGKKTFGNIFSKVKAKIQEMDQPRQTSDGYDPGRYEQRVSYNPPQIPPPNIWPQNAGSNSPPQLNQPPSASIQGYDTNPEQARQGTSVPQISTAPAPTESMNIAAGSPSPPRTSSGFGPGTSAPIDAGKLGLLPKRPVSLLRPQDSTAQPMHRQGSHDESDGLEYAESPFEDKHK